jgi:hypothetical protein
MFITHSARNSSILVAKVSIVSCMCIMQRILCSFSATVTKLGSWFMTRNTVAVEDAGGAPRQ